MSQVLEEGQLVRLRIAVTHDRVAIMGGQLGAIGATPSPASATGTLPLGDTKSASSGDVSNIGADDVWCSGVFRVSSDPTKEPALSKMPTNATSPSPLGVATPCAVGQSSWFVLRTLSGNPLCPSFRPSKPGTTAFTSQAFSVTVGAPDDAPLLWNTSPSSGAGATASVLLCVLSDADTDLKGLCLSGGTAASVLRSPPCCGAGMGIESIACPSPMQVCDALSGFCGDGAVIGNPASSGQAIPRTLACTSSISSPHTHPASHCGGDGWPECPTCMYGALLEVVAMDLTTHTHCIEGDASGNVPSSSTGTPGSGSDPATSSGQPEAASVSPLLIAAAAAGVIGGGWVLWSRLRNREPDRTSDQSRRTTSATTPTAPTTRRRA